MKVESIRTRVAPSPTGLPHIGTVFQALLDYIIAKQNKGTFVLRIEDTDQKRLDPQAEQAVYEALEWVNIQPDESPKAGGAFGPYRQSERLLLYHKYAQQLVDQGAAYYCFCSAERLESVRNQMQKDGKPPMYDKLCRSISPSEAKERAAAEPHVIRLKVPTQTQISVLDAVRGTIVFNSDDIDDQVLLKSDGFPTYHLAVVVDDHLMEISHVVRGEEWLSSAPKHILLYDYFNWQKPVFFHTPTLRNPDKSKLSKRHGHTTVEWYRSEGIVPEALINFLLSIVWTHPDQSDIFSLQEAIELFKFQSVHITGPIVDLAKLRWINGQYIRAYSKNDFVNLAQPFLPADFPKEKAASILPLIHERLEQLNQIESLTDFFYRPIVLDEKPLLQRSTAEVVINQLTGTIDRLEALPEWNLHQIEDAIRSLQEKNDWQRKQYFMLLRYSTTGKSATPPLFETIEVLGKTLTIDRLISARTLITS
ncbi:MAG TPA: glutamate--tRNA ligase [Candidatus Woesebacteria bacterium]|nr:glutamate--tRNA ligase [Candidatus Woesebacteria bacterium]